MRRQPTKAAVAQRRRGGATVEFAVAAPLLFLLVLGSIEFGRALMVTEFLAHAARSGARVGVVSSGTNSTVTSAVDTQLVNAQIPTTGRQVTILVNGSPGNVQTAPTGSEITVRVTIPAANTSWLPVQRFVGNTTLSGTVVMRKE
jgi:Flp pilus assembly protein TadG